MQKLGRISRNLWRYAWLINTLSRIPLDKKLTPSLSGLRELQLTDCEILESIPDAIQNLRYLSISGCNKLATLPNSLFESQQLEVVDKYGSLSNLRRLRLTDCEILECIPDTIQNLSDLSISGCNKLATLPNSLFESQQLNYLKIHRCSGLVKLPISLGVQKNLCGLEIDGCENLKKLPSSIQMKSLEKLRISNSPKLDTFPEIDGDMHYLTQLTLNSTGIREVPSSIGNLSGLTLLKLSGCEDLVSLPDSICNLMNLQRLFLGRCRKLEKLPENMGDLQELCMLDASKTAIYQLPPSITKLGKLWTLRFSHEKQLRHSSSFVLHQISGLSSLQELHLNNLNILGGLPEELGSLRKLDVSGSNISCLPKSFKGLLHLQHLNVQFWQNLNKLPGELPPHLDELRADYHLALMSIRDLVIHYPKLCRLGISDCGAVSSEQVNVFLQHFLRTCIQFDFLQRDYFLISFPYRVGIPELFDYDWFINQKGMSIDLNPSWYTDKFMGFWISYGPTTLNYSSLEVTLVCKSDPERKYSLKYSRIHPYSRVIDHLICCVYIPFETLWNNGYGNKEGKNPNDYYMLEVYALYRQWKELRCLGIRLVYEKDAMSDDLF